MEHLQVHLASSTRRSMGVDKITALAIKKEVGDVEKERRITRSITRGSMGSALDNIKAYMSDSE